jgi:hypothetical protein
VTALKMNKMRANVTGEKAPLARATIKVDRACRKCHIHKETLGHILGQCIHTKKERTKRHDEIKVFILKKIVERDKEAVVIREPTL